MTKAEFLRLLGQAYNFPDYYAHNLDSAEEILSDIRTGNQSERLSLRPLMERMLQEVSEEDREEIMDLLYTYFWK